MYAPVSHGHANYLLRPNEVVAAFVVVLLVCVLVIFRAAHLPTPVSSSVPLTTFSEERARVYLNDLLAIGPQRPVGTHANEVETPKYILKEVEKIRKESGANIETDRQFGSWSFTLDFLGGFTSVYQDVQNVLVMLRGTEHSPENGVLMISAHYDTPVGTKGASDNTANVANMLEILRVMAHKRPRRSCLFMFTGAEETILQGSHSFANSNHK